jgi:uncharacterized protein (TIGR00730 family)
MCRVIKKRRNIMNICIYAAASDNINSKYIKNVEHLGKELAKDGNGLIYGAGGTGLMGAAARGFREGNGQVIGVTPAFMQEIEPIFNDCTKVIITDTMAERKEVMENGADAFLIVPGGIGTFDEFFQCITLKELGQLDKPIIIYNCENYYTKLLEYMNDCMEKGFIREGVDNFYKVATTPKEVVEIIDNLKHQVKKNTFEIPAMFVANDILEL